VTGPVERPEEPSEEIDRGDEREEDKPEPKENEELLVEEVDSEGALEDVAVYTGLVADVELAECYTRKLIRITPVLLNTHIHRHT